MRNIWYNKRQYELNLKMLTAIILLVIMTLWSITGISIAQSANMEQQTQELSLRVHKAVMLCYAIEGSYPPDIEYLEENYNLSIDHKKYIINYEAFASNIMPQISIFQNISK